LQIHVKKFSKNNSLSFQKLWSGNKYQHKHNGGEVLATYPVKHKDTGETKEIQMSVHDWSQWCEDNPDWSRYYTPDNAPCLGIEMGDPLSKIYTKHPGWKDVMTKAKQQPGSTLKHYD